VFEFITDALGAQGPVLGGGRYDGLIGHMGGPDTPAVGWAAGIERLAMLVTEPLPARVDVAVVPETSELEGEAIRIVSHLRRNGVNVIMPFKGNARRRAELAAKANVQTVLYIRDALRTRDSLNLVDRVKDDGAAGRMLDILGRLPADYAALSGENEG
jgi:histidyl-tRNA synthetase